MEARSVDHIPIRINILGKHRLPLARWSAPGCIFRQIARSCGVPGRVLLHAYGLRGIRSSTAVTLMNLVPVFGLAVSLLFFA